MGEYAFRHHRRRSSPSYPNYQPVAPLIAKITNLFSRFFKADIVKVFSLTSISTLVRMCTGLVSVKIVAAIIGPTGVALVGQLNNFASIMLSFSSGGINSGITKYIAEYRDDREYVVNLLSTALRITAACSLVCGLALIVLHSQFSQLVMLSDDYGYVFIIFGFTILLYALNNMLTSIINGYKEFQKFVYVNIANSIIGVIFTIVLVLLWNLKGALISAVTFQSIMLFVTLFMLRNEKWMQWRYFKEKLSSPIVRKYFNYSLMAFATALTAPVVQMILRGYVMSEISTIEAGWWEGMNRISNMYLMVITSSLTVYYLPRLSEITDPTELRQEIARAYKAIVPILLAGFAIIYFLRFFIIHLLFTPDFLPMSKLFIWQLAGDILKICSWMLSFLMVAKAMTKAFLTTEFLFSATWLILGFIFVHLNGIVGLCQAYLVNFFIYFVAMIVLFKNVIFYKG